MATKTQERASSGLNKLILNNFIVKNRHNVRRAKVHVSNKITRRVSQLRSQKAENDQEKQKFLRKADRLIEELPVIRKFHVDDLSKFALLNRKGLVETTNDTNSTLEERALVRVATWKTVAPEIEKFRGEYPDWAEKIPPLLQVMGLQYRKQRLKRLDKKGRKDQFLEKEHRYMSMQQKLTHIDIDPSLLVKAGKLMKASKQNNSEHSSNEEMKDYGEYSFDELSKRNQDVHGDDSLNTSVCKKEKKIKLKTKEKKRQFEEPVDEATDRMQKKLKIRRLTKAEEEKCDKKDNSSMDQEEAYSSDDSDDDDVKTKLNEAVSEGEDSEDDDHLHEKIREESVVRKNENGILRPKKSHLRVDERTTKEDKKGEYASSYEEDSAISDDGEDSESEMSEVEGSVDFDSEGSIVDENFVGNEITSIWDDFKDKKSKTKPQISKNSEGNVSGNKLIKNKGTVEVRRLDLTDKKCIDTLLEENQKVLSDSEEEEEDFFVRKPKPKKRKRTSENSCDGESEAEGGENDSSHSDEEFLKDGHHSDNEISTRECYLDKNFKRIWGKGMEDTIRESRGRRGYGRGGRGFRGGGFHDNRGRGRGFYDNIERGFRGRGFDNRERGFRGRGFNDNRERGFRGRGFDDNRELGFRGRGFDDNRRRSFRGRERDVDNSNLIPLGSKFPSEHCSDTSALFSGGRATSQLDPESQSSFVPRGRGHSSWKSKRENFGNKTRDNTNLGYGQESGGEPVKPGWKRGRFEKRDPNNANLMPLKGSWNDNISSDRKESSQGSLLHPSWLAKQKQRELASNIHNFQGKVKKFDFDD